MKLRGIPAIEFILEVIAAFAVSHPCIFYWDWNAVRSASVWRVQCTVHTRTHNVAYANSRYENNGCYFPEASIYSFSFLFFLLSNIIVAKAPTIPPAIIPMIVMNPP